MRRKSIERRTIESLIANTFLFGINFLQNIVLVPILLASWGASKYGLWISIYAFFSLLQSLDIGHQNYVGNEFNKLFYLDKKKAWELLGSSLYVAIIIGGISLLLIIGLNVTGLVNAIIDLDNSFKEDHVGWALVVLSTMWILAGSVGGILVRIILPLGLMARFTYLSIVLKLLLFSILALGAWFKWSLLQVILIYSLAELIYAWGIFWYIRKVMPEFYPWWKQASFSTGLTNFKRSLVLTLNSFLDQFSNNGLVLVISSFLTASVVPAFTTMRTVANTALIGTNTFLQSVSPDIIRLHVNNEKGKLKQVFFANWFITGLPINFIFLILPLFAQPLYTWWTMGQIPYDSSLLFILMASVSISNFFKGFTSYLLYINDLAINFYVSVIRVFIILSITILGISTFGLCAPAAGFLLAECITGIIIYKRANRHLLEGNGEFTIQQISLSFMPVALLLIWFILHFAGIPVSLWTVATFGIVMTIFYLTLFLKNGNYLMNRVKQMRSKATLI